MIDSLLNRWVERRAANALDLDQLAPGVFKSYQRDRSMGLEHERAIEHAMRNWTMSINMRRQMAGQPMLQDDEIAAMRQRVEVLAGQGGTEQVIAHAMPMATTKTASALWFLHFAKAKHNPAYEKETAVIRENKKKPEADKPHDFKPAKWTHPNGHPRCLTCGGEEIIGGRCNVTPTAKDYAEFQAELDAEFPENAKRRKEQTAALGDMFERGEITHTDLQRRLAAADESERLLSAYWAGNITQTDFDHRLQRLRASA